MVDSTVSVGAPAPSGVGALLSNPRVLLLGGGAAVLLVVFLVTRGRTATANPDNESIDGATTPDQALALGSLEAKLGERSGRLEEMLAGLGVGLSDVGNDVGGFSDAIAGLAGQLGVTAEELKAAISGSSDDLAALIGSRADATDTMLGDLGGQIGTGFGGLGTQIGAGFNGLGTQIGAGFGGLSSQSVAEAAAARQRTDEWGNLLATLAQQNQNIIRGYDQNGQSIR